MSLSSVDLPRLRRVLDTPALRRVLDALEKRQRQGRPLTGTLTLAEATDAEREAIDELLGRPATTGRDLRVNLAALSETLQFARMAPSLEAAIEALRGPIGNSKLAAAAIREAWRALATAADDQLRPWPEIGGWFRVLLRTGVLKRLAHGSADEGWQLLHDLVAVCRALPAAGEPLSVFAARLFGDAHALDPGTPRATLSVRTAARIGRIPFTDNAETRRMAWASVGVMSDELSAPVLVLNLPVSNDTPLGRLLRTAAADAEPLHVSQLLLLRHPLNRDPTMRDRTIYVCENPSIVALAARRLGARCAPLLCVNGQFATTTLVLLRQLRAAGARLRYHGDFDPAGLQIAHRVMTEGGAAPWRFDRVHYRAAPKSVRFDGRPGPTPWDPALQAAMREDGRLVHEEAVFDQLAGDLMA